MAETSSLLNCRTCKGTGGSNPPASAEVRTKRQIIDGYNLTWWIHLMVRIQDSQSWHRGSIPLSTTKRGFKTPLFVFPRCTKSVLSDQNVYFLVSLSYFMASACLRCQRSLPQQVRAMPVMALECHSGYPSSPLSSVDGNG